MRSGNVGDIGSTQRSAALGVRDTLLLFVVVLAAAGLGTLIGWLLWIWL